MARRVRSISLPIILGATTVALSIAMLVGWIVVILQNSALSREVVQNTWLLITGTVSLMIIMSVLVLFSVFLVRETLEIRRQDSFIDSVTHELKSPLASLKLCLETMERPNVQPQMRDQLRQMMLDDVERLTVFIDDVLQSSRLTHGWEGHALTTIEVLSTLQACAEAIARRHRLPTSAIRLELPADLRLVTDRTAFETVMKNLLDNAVKYSNPPAAVAVVARREARWLRVDVTDNGIGIPPRHLKRIFERFYRVPLETVRSRRGTGLGLFVVSALVRGLGGRLEAQSAGEGQGATFTMWLPIDSSAQGQGVRYGA